MICPCFGLLKDLHMFESFLLSNQSPGPRQQTHIWFECFSAKCLDQSMLVSWSQMENTGVFEHLRVMGMICIDVMGEKNPGHRKLRVALISTLWSQSSDSKISVTSKILKPFEPLVPWGSSLCRELRCLTPLL